MAADGPLYRRFHVDRVDGTSQPGGKHDGCDYFVLDLTHDPYAAVALRAYAISCATTHRALAHDLWKQAAAIDDVLADRQAASRALSGSPTTDEGQVTP